jgi:LuxR family maltose regulon positive regulatory protein
MPSGVVERVALVKLLLSAGPGELVSISAPAGYGKTTAVALWEDAETKGQTESATKAERPFAWVRIDHLDDDPVHLLLHIATSVGRTVELEPGLLEFLCGQGRDPIAHLVPALIGALEGCGPMVIVLDDLHEVSSPAAIAALRALIGDAPASAIFVLVDRRPCLVDLARRRLHRRVLEIGVAELTLSVGEADAVFDAAGGPRDERTASAVFDKCEGWPAGVVLAAMALRDGADPAVLSGRHRLVADYLVEEVLTQLDPAAATFLMESSVLDKFCAAQLDEILERNDSKQMLDTVLHSGNVFLIPLDDERIWYRYHRLFGDLLRARQSERDFGRFRSLATRAADVVERDGDLDGALRQALVVQDRGRAAALVGRDAVRMGFDGRVGVLARRLAMLDELTFAGYPDAAVARAWFGVTTGNAELIQRSLAMAAMADRGLPLADGTPSVSVATALVGSLVGIGGVREVVRHADVVCAAGEPLVNPWWGAATVLKGAAMAMLGDQDQARQLLTSALPAVANLPGFHAAALAHLALIDLSDGDDAAAIERSALADKIADEFDLRDVVPMVVVYSVSALTAARTGDISRSRQAIVATERLLNKLGDLAARTALLGHGLLALTAAALQDNDLLTKHLAAAEYARKREPDAIGLIRRLEWARVLAVGGEQRPLTAAELRLLPYLATHLSLQSIGAALFIGRETVKSQATSIYRKLAVSSRAAAVAEAERLGLISR